MRTIITNLDGEKELVNLSEPFYSGKITKIEHDYSKTLIEALWIGPRSGRMFAQIYRKSAVKLRPSGRRYKACLAL